MGRKYLAIVPFNGGTRFTICESQTDAYNFIMTAKSLILKEYDVRVPGYVFDLGEATEIIP